MVPPINLIINLTLLVTMSSIPNKLKSIAPSSLKNKFYALRHGQSLANVAKIISSDPKISTVEHGLSDVGREQVKASVAAFSVTHMKNKDDEKYSGVAVYASDFTRAKETAAIFAKGLKEANIPVKGGDVISEIRLRERYFGKWNGKSDIHYNDVWKFDCEDPNHTEEDVESVNSVMERTSGLVLEIEEQLKSNSDETYKVILVAHGDVLQILQTAFQKKNGSVHRSLEHLETATVREFVLSEE